MQRGYKEIIKAADEGKNEEVTSLLADKSYLSEASKKTFAAINSLNDYSISKNEANIKKYVKGRGGWSGILWLFSALGAVMLIFTGDNSAQKHHQSY